MQGCFPSHLIFLRRHSSQARVTRRRFWMGCEGASGFPSALSSRSSDLVLEVGDGGSAPCQSLGPAPSSALSLAIAGSWGIESLGDGGDEGVDGGEDAEGECE